MMNIAGVSLIPATTPRPTPAHRRCGGLNTSAIMTAKMRRLIWPSWTDWRTGSSQIIPPTRRAARLHNPCVAHPGIGGLERIELGGQGIMILEHPVVGTPAGYFRS